jgi:hypothetical protein
VRGEEVQNGLVGGEVPRNRAGVRRDGRAAGPGVTAARDLVEQELPALGAVVVAADRGGAVVAAVSGTGVAARVREQPLREAQPSRVAGTLILFPGFWSAHEAGPCPSSKLDRAAQGAPFSVRRALTGGKTV